MSDIATPSRGPKRIAWLPLIALAVVPTACAWLFMSSGSLNVDAFVAIQSITRVVPDTLWSMVTLCGNGAVAFALLSPTLARRPRWFAAGLAAAPLGGLYSNGFKHVFGLPRPAAIVDPAQLHVIGDTLRANTFPSGHSITAFAVAALLVLASTRPLRTAAWAVPAAALIALSRVAVGAHWPADIAAGAAGGWLCGALGVMAAERWRFWNTTAGVRVMGVVAIGVGVSLFIVDLGYPLGLPLQVAAGVVGIASGLFVVARPRVDPVWPRRTR